jgi:hypothetical protein
MKVWKTAVLILLVVLAIGLILLKFKSAASLDLLPVANVAASPPSQWTHYLYDSDASFDAPVAAQPGGLQTLAQIPFRINGLIQYGARTGRDWQDYRDVRSHSGDRKFQSALCSARQLVHAAVGTPIAEVVFHYADGSTATHPILYGTDSMDWWEPLRSKKPTSADSASKVIWRGDHQSLPDWVKSLRLFGTGIPNPKPKSEVKAVDLVSTKSRVTWIVLALTTGPAGLLKVDPQLEREQAPAPEITLHLTALDKDSGKPVPDMRLEITLLSGRRPKFYGFYTTDEKGQAIIDLPPEHIKQLSIKAAASDYAPAEMSWNLEQGEKVPTNYVFKVVKNAP